MSNDAVLEREYIEVYTEVWRIIQLLPQNERNLIPIETMDFLDRHKDLTTGRPIDLCLPLEKQGISDDALCVLAGIMMDIRKRLKSRQADN